MMLNAMNGIQLCKIEFPKRLNLKASLAVFYALMNISLSIEHYHHLKLIVIDLAQHKSSRQMEKSLSRTWRKTYARQFLFTTMCDTCKITQLEDRCI